MATDMIARGLAISNSGGGGSGTSVDVQAGTGISFSGTDPIIINNNGVTDVQPGTNDGTVKVVIAGKESKSKEVHVKGLSNAAYKDVDTAIDETAKDSENLPTTKAVKESLDKKVDTSKLEDSNGVATLDENKKLKSAQLPSHNHGSNEVNIMMGYSKPSTLDDKAIKNTDTLNDAIGKLEKNLDDKMDDGNYAGSSTKGGSATSAEKLSITEQIGTNKKPVYFSADGVPVAIDHTINSDVPENAKFTDTKYSAGTGIRVADDTMYNMGVLSVNESATNGCVDFTVGKNGTETSESKTIPVHGIGDAAYRGVDTVVTKDSANLITSGAVSTELDKKMNSSMRNSTNGVAGLDSNSKINVSQIPTTDEYNVESAYPVTSKAVEAAMNTLPNPMLYKGSLGTGGTITALPTASASNEGFTYKVITSGTYAGQSAKVGDVFISNGTEWTIIPSGDEPEGTVISVGMSVPTGLKIKEGTSPVTTSGTIEVLLDDGYVIPKTADIVPSTRKINNITLESDVVLDGDDIKATGYAKAESKSNITGTDTINQALGKLELKSDTNETNILLVENGSYKTHNLTDNIVRLTENKDGYAYITSTAGDVIKSIGKNLINPTEYEGTTGSGHFTTTAASDGSCIIVSDGANWTHNGYVSGKVKIPITKPGTFYFVCEHISGNIYTQNAPTTPVVCGHQLVLFDASGTKVGTETYSNVSFLAETGTVLRTKTITAELIQAGAITLQIAIWGNGTTSAGYRIYDNYKFRIAAYFDDNSITVDTPYQPYKESVETCDASGHCYIMTYEDGSVYSQNDYPTKTITIDYPESDFAVRFNESEKVTDGIDKSDVNYIEMKSGQRVYADTEEPYGNIEVGSIGVGFDSGLREFGVGAKKSATTFPVTFGTDGTPITDYTIYGNTGGVGDRSANYVDRMNLDVVELYPNKTTGTVEATSGTNYSIIIPASSLTDCFFSINRETTAFNRCRLAGYATYPEVGTTATFVDNVTSTATDDTSGNYYYNSNGEIPAGTNYIMVFLASDISSISSVDIFREAVKASKPMLTSGTEKLPYVKYYSIPITCNSVTSEISLDAPLAADELVTYKDSGSPIYTVDGQNTMAFSSTVLPSKIDFEYVGWRATDEITKLIERLESVEKRVTTISHVYGIYIDGNNSNPSTRVTYIEDAIGMKPAFMNYETDKFDYGSWGNAWFMPKPCMLKSDGTVAYYLDPMDYSKKIDGTESDISNDDFDGNAMMEWGTGGKKIWTKTVPVLGDPTSCYKYFADEQIDPDYHAYSFIGSDGKMKDHFYTPIYHGSVVGTKLRSLSGKAPCMSKTAQQEIDLATANGNGWYVEQFCDIELINDLLVLIGKSTDTQTVFGKGNCDGYENNSSINYGMINSGTMDGKGLFWGSNVSDTSNRNGVKVFGMENWWGNQWRRFAGLILDSGIYKTKMCYGVSDGSTTQGYNLTGDGYVSSGITPGGTSGGYINIIDYSNRISLPKTASGSSSTYYCDGLWFNNSIVAVAVRGGHCGNGARCGAFSLVAHYAASSTHWTIGAALSFKSP